MSQRLKFRRTGRVEDGDRPRAGGEEAAFAFLTPVPLLTPQPSLISPPLIIGHRGAAAEAPENTLTAFELALDQGADGIEFDVHLSADGVPVVIHDPRLERTTSGWGRVRDYTLGPLKRLDAGSWFNRRYPRRAKPGYAGLRIPTLAETLALVRERRCLAYVEIKQGRRPYRGLEESVLEAIGRVGVRDRAMVVSFHLPTLERLRELDGSIALGVDFTRPKRALTSAFAVGAGAILPHWAFASRRFIARAHAAGRHVLVWDLDQKLWMRRKTADGVDGIITSRPARMAAVRAWLSGS